MRYFLLLFLLLDIATSPARAQVDLSGTWYDPTQGGTGFTIEQAGQEETLTYFIAWFAYTNAGLPYWVAATLSVTDQQHAAGNVSAYSGKGFGPAYNPATVSGATVGTMTMSVTPNLESATTVSISYTVNGVSGTYNLQRYPAATPTVFLNAFYVGGVRELTSTCSTQFLNGMGTLQVAPGSSGTVKNLASSHMTLTPTGGQMTINVTLGGSGLNGLTSDSCTVSGSYTTANSGSVLNFSGAQMSCHGGLTGSFSALQMLIRAPTIAMPYTLNITTLEKSPSGAVGVGAPCTSSGFLVGTF